MEAIYAMFSAVRKTSTVGAATVVAVALVTLTPTAGAASGERGYELVSHRDMGGTFAVFAGALGSIRANTRGMKPASDDGERYLFSTFQTAAPGTPTTRPGPLYIAERGSAGWTQRYVGAPGDQVDISQLWTVSSDLSRVFLYVLGGGQLGGALDPDDPGDEIDAYAREPNGSFTWLAKRPFPIDGSSYEAVSANGAAPLFRPKETFGDGPIMTEGSSGAEPVSILDNDYVMPSDSANVSRIENDRTRVSADGQRVVFLSSRQIPAPGVRLVFVRLLDEDRTVVANEPEPGVSSTQVDITSLESVSDDGSDVFFTTAQALTLDDLDTQVDLYRFDVDAEDLELVSKSAPGAPGTGQSGSCSSTYGVSGCAVTPIVTSPDGSTAYFISPEQLTIGSVANAPNLYSRRDGVTKLVATLDTNDANSLDTSSIAQFRAPNDALRPARVSEDGGRLAFESRAQLTSFANSGLRQVYLYDEESGAIACASCPQNAALGSDAEGMLTAVRGSAGISEGPPIFETNPADHGRNLAADGGLVYFQTTRRLVEGDTNGKMDVYEYDFDDDSVALISSGKAPLGSIYYDNSDDGEDVFFATQETLAPPEQDLNGTAWKIYDARLGGGFPAVVDPDCGESDCRGPLAGPPNFDAPGSQTEGGEGNVQSRRVRLALSGPSRRALARASSTGRLALRIRSSATRRVHVVARTRLRRGGKLANVGSASKRLRAGKTSRIVLRLSPSTRRALAGGRTLRLQVRVAAAGARTRTLGLTLRRADR